MRSKSIIQAGIVVLMFLGLGFGFYEGAKSLAQDGCEVGVLSILAQTRPDIYMKLEEVGVVDNFTNTYCTDVLSFE